MLFEVFEFSSLPLLVYEKLYRLLNFSNGGCQWSIDSCVKKKKNVSILLLLFLERCNFVALTH